MRARAILGVAAVGLLAVACGMAIKRDLTKVTPQEVLYDDLCGLQDYFDVLEVGLAAAPRPIEAIEMEKSQGGRSAGGKTTFAFETDYQLQHLRRVLGENWRRLPESLASASAAQVEVRWSEKASVRRVVTTEDALLRVDKKEHALPYHVCLSDLLFGAPLYRTRRAMLRASPLPLWSDAGASTPDASLAPAPPADAGDTD